MSTASNSGSGGHSHGHDHHHDDEFDRGLSYDLPVFARRRMIRLLAGASMVPLVAACSTDDSSSGAASDSASSGSSSSGTSGSDCEVIPTETAGPYPGDGSNGPNVLKESGVVRRDITKSFGSSSGVAEGIPLTITLTVVDQSSGCDTPKEGAAVYLWHCDREGLYSLYSDGVTEENYLRGVQETDDKGQVTFTSIFPGCYTGRWPHIHFEVYGSLDDATAAQDIAATSQLAFPKDVCDTVYATDGYSQSVQNLGELSLESDMIFRDGYDQQLATLEGSTDKGYTATLTVPV
ncbi:intradiol ring-cleavage dioxygenase [Streptomyces europaeiscabiei]|uniref:Intradiol ring-cleavage dioxygenase n=1 Tax=Streptomyces europaeiscabiei TaxID=146819 RepID=A0ABU4NR42_9ACTN|nr:intradiol ring-cleavage dioxygenase [Streptomyces europaeiscabiei]MDX2522884.1 intradiol ring-cleavage dioxygenase [Streptomyces europaeiscabiei]MDX2758830.1 intradiol ring-cleavage dioxygenase [Streptomyces europaeiscabiei]MDX2769250.1 intradiol ring-cleavage dioxygenase [Streptomyces europaeiscabiei]MDX3547128.1 intradiol ring-cleavage dioxygenase [Streptomyces europaeiscabiei]MDX3556951.1 intradiol ring-cleavage dioxygenase [Streptomyces europaeiscabiei]